MSVQFTNADGSENTATSTMLITGSACGDPVVVIRNEITKVQRINASVVHLLCRGPVVQSVDMSQTHRAQAWRTVLVGEVA